MSHSDAINRPTTDVALTVRAAGPGDLDAVIRLDTETSGMAKPAYWRNIFQTFVPDQKGERYLLIVDVEGVAAGFVVGEVRAWEFGSPPCGWVFALGVANAYREHHVGSRLMQEIFNCFRRDGVESVRTNVSRLDTLNLSFFRSLGMTAGPYVQLEISLDEDEAGDP
jgi:ribosomal protein S18 acetylase RimI-like enzyme